MPRRRGDRPRRPPGCFSASIVALTTLWGFEEPSDFVRTSRTPADSSTARTPPPAISPVPGEAGFSITLPAPNRPITGCGMVPVDDRHGHDVLLRVVDPLGDRVRDLVRLAETDADVSLAVAHHDDRVEAEPAAALHHLGHAVDVDELVLQLQFTCFDTCQRHLV